MRSLAPGLGLPGGVRLDHHLAEACKHMSSVALAPSLEDEVPPETAEFFRRSLRVLVDAEVPFLVGGAFAHACFTGIRRATKDLDLFIRRQDYERVASLMEAEGWHAELSY